MLPSLLFAATPWLWPSTLALVVSLCAHAAWFALCEITPLLSMLRYAVSSDATRPISLLYSARDRQAAAFLPELRVLAAR